MNHKVIKVGTCAFEGLTARDSFLGIGRVGLGNDYTTVPTFRLVRYDDAWPYAGAIQYPQGDRLPHEFDRVTVEMVICRAHRHFLLNGLADNQAVERIAMMERQAD